MYLRSASYFIAIFVVASILILLPQVPADRRAGSLPDDVRSTTTQRRIAQSEAMGRFLRAPLPFEANVGQTDSVARFIARGLGYTVFFTPKSVVLSLSDSKVTGRENVVEMQIVGARDAEVRGLDQLASRSHYFRGNSPQAWHTDVPHYAKVSYTGAVPDTELIFYGRQGELEYDMVLGPRVDPGGVVLQFSGTAGLTINGDGDLVLAFRDGRQILQRRPKVYQQSGGRKTEIAGRYRLVAANRVRFDVAGYNHHLPLVIDPVLTYSSYLGGTSTGNDQATALAIDSAGNVYVAGFSGSVGFPTGSVPPIQPKRAGGNDAFIAKLSADASTLIYSTYLGGSDDDQATGIAVDSAGRAYVVGTTASTNFPTTPGSFAPTQPAPGQNVFVAKLNTTGSQLFYSTYLGPGLGGTITANGNGVAYVTGTAYCCSFPTTPGAFQTTGVSNDAFITKINAAGSALAWSTLLGGSFGSGGTGIALDSAQNVYVTGYTISSDFPVTSGAFQTTFTGYQDVFVTKMNASGSSPVYSTLLGGSYSQQGTGIVVDTSGFAYLTGYTYSSDFPTTPGVYQNFLNGYEDAFVTKINQKGTALVYSTFLGSYTTGNAIAVDTSGDAYVTGNGSVPVTPGAYSNPVECCSFLTKLDPTGTTLIYSSQPGFSQFGSNMGFAVDPSGNAYIASFTSSTDHPVTPGVYQPSLAGGTDATIMKLNSSGTALVYSTFLGGSGGDQGLAIALDSAGSAYVTGSAGSLDFPVTITPDSRPLAGPYTQAFVTKFNAAGTGLVYSTFVSGSSNDTGRAITVDRTGAVYVAGQTNSTDFPVTGGALQSTNAGGYDAFLFKLSPAGHLAYSTYLGGSSDDDGRGVSVDSAGNAYIAGNTGSSNFPRTSAIGNLSYYANVFVAKINSTGSQFVYSAVLGGSNSQSESGIAVDSSGSAYITGSTYSIDFPVTPGAFQTVAAGYQEAFVTKLNASGAGLVYSTLLGGVYSTSGNAIAVDSAGDAYVTGYTTSPNFPVTAGAFQPTIAGSQNAFVTKLNSSGSALGYSTYLGGSGADQGNAIAVDSSGAAYVAGSTSSPNFPTVNGATIMEVAIPNYFSSAFVSSLNSTGSALQYSTYLGSQTSANAISVQSGQTVVAGTTSGSELIGAAPGYQKTIAPGAENAFVSEISSPPAGCTYAVSPASFNFGSSGGTGTINVTAGAGCPWIGVAPNGSRIQLQSIPPGSSVMGVGNGSVTFTEPSDFYDSGSVTLFTVAGQLITATQTGPCLLTLATNSITVGPGGLNSGSLSFTAPCGVNFFTTTPWISALSYFYSGLNYTVLPNLTNMARTGIIYVGPQVFTIKQLGAKTTAATMLDPLPGATLSGSSVTFVWTPISGADQYRLSVGTSAGQANICSTQTASTQYTCANMPTDGSTVYVALRTHDAGAWGQPLQYTYTAASTTVAQLMSPAPVTPYPGPPTTVLPGTKVGFLWSAGIGADKYELDVGTALGGSDICTLTTSNTEGTCNVPCSGNTVYAQLSTHWSGAWQPPLQYVYLACTATLGVITSPTPLSTFSGSTVTFKWTGGVGADMYKLYVGTAAGQGDVCSVTTATTQAACQNMPTNGETIYVQLATHVNGAWQPPNQYTYTAALNP